MQISRHGWNQPEATLPCDRPSLPG